MATSYESSFVTRLLEGLEVHGMMASELYLILVMMVGVARVLAALAVRIVSPWQGPGF